MFYTKQYYRYYKIVIDNVYISKKQAQESLRRLEEKEIITRVFRTIERVTGECHVYSFAP